MKKHFIALSVVVAFISFSAPINSCSGDYELKLKNGYSIVRVYSGAVLLKDQHGNVVVLPNIKSYYNNDVYIIGVINNEGMPSGDEYRSKPGYFIVILSTGVTRQGLSEDKLLEELKKYGTNELPSMNPPSRI